MKDINLDDFKELYNRLKPALNSKTKELKLKDKIIIKEEDLFNYLKDNVWNKEKNTSLFDMVSDIMYVDEDKLLDYINMNIFKKNVINFIKKDNKEY